VALKPFVFTVDVGRTDKCCGAGGCQIAAGNLNGSPSQINRGSSLSCLNIIGATYLQGATTVEIQRSRGR